MTQDEIIEMAKEARIHRDDSWRFEMLQEKNALEAFAKLMAEKTAAKEREACAQTCENLPIPNQFSESEGSVWDVAALDCAAAIRARSGEQK